MAEFRALYTINHKTSTLQLLYYNPHTYPSLAVIQQDPIKFFTMAAINDVFDFVVIGGGTAGLVVAARLTENPNVNVVVLEAGDSYIGDPRINLPAGWPALLGTEADWNFKTTPQVSY